MLAYVIALLTAALVLAAVSGRSESGRWASLFLLCASTGGLAELWRSGAATGDARAVELLALFNVTFTPYAVLIFALVYDRLGSSGGRRLWKGLLAVPALLTLGIAWAGTAPVQPDYRVLLLWAGPYYAAACWLLVYALRREQEPAMRRNRLVTTTIMVPTLLAVTVLIYVGRALDPAFDFFPYVAYFILYSLSVAALCVFAYGVLGVRLRLERDPLEQAMQAASTGVSVLNHTIKNEAGKIAIHAELLKRRLPAADAAARDQLGAIAAASDHLLQMAGRLHARTQRVMMKPRVCALHELIEQAAAAWSAELSRRRIELRLALDGGHARVRCDPAHMLEVLHVGIGNAVEAMDGGGTLRITLHRRRRHVELTIADSGHGIAKSAAARVFEPFFTTRGGGRNYGLGLAYAHNVMRAAGGAVKLVSEPGSGTELRLRLPLVRKPQSGKGGGRD
ncbi:histidine kinase [Paenibacillus sp. IB182496]|uniref:histidine kinase n=1 Tax=Paenibacillus sabuli TaxID=2772509 RepID=A0A927BUI0_9BACL|nr:sensor histidine kinase [Paenibacillus sabuli]MBD2845975.1 histidine kinase [Paenibacillus sabuli]